MIDPVLVVGIALALMGIGLIYKSGAVARMWPWEEVECLLCEKLTNKRATVPYNLGHVCNKCQENFDEWRRQWEFQYIIDRGVSGER